MAIRCGESFTPVCTLRPHGKRCGPPVVPILKTPTEITTADTAEPFRFAFPDLSGRQVRSDDARFRGKVVLVDIIGSWCPDLP